MNRSCLLRLTSMIRHRRYIVPERIVNIDLHWRRRPGGKRRGERKKRQGGDYVRWCVSTELVQSCLRLYHDVTVEYCKDNSWPILNMEHTIQTVLVNFAAEALFLGVSGWNSHPFHRLLSHAVCNRPSVCTLFFIARMDRRVCNWSSVWLVLWLTSSKLLSTGIIFLFFLYLWSRRNAAYFWHERFVFQPIPNCISNVLSKRF